MKLKIGLGLLLIVALLVTMTACTGPSVKTTGGGWFTDCKTLDKITFGFTAIPTGDDKCAKGQFELIDHVGKGGNVNIHGEFNKLGIVNPNFNTTKFFGTCSINGQREYDFEVQFTDNGNPGVDPGDMIKVYISGWGSKYKADYYGELGGGNIVIHVPND